MHRSEKRVRVLWFSITPGLTQHPSNNKIAGGGWIASLQTGVEQRSDVELGFVFYHNEKLDPFTGGRTKYYPVTRIGSSKKKRLLHRVTGKTEYEENVPAFLRIIADFKPDIIHIHGTEFPFGLITKHIQEIPIVISIQGNLTVYEKKYFAGIGMPGFIRQLRSGYPFFGVDFAIWKKRVRIEQEIMKKTRYIFGRTDWDRRISLVLAPDARYFHLDEVLRPPFYKIKWTPPANKVPVFFTTSSASLYKGFETILETARLLVGNQFSFTWLVAGLRENDPMVKLFKKEMGIDDLSALNVRLIGSITAEELASSLEKADVYVQVSHIENSPNSLCEAMLAGLPVIASYAGGTASLLPDRIHGTLVQNGDPYALAGGLMEIVRKPEAYIRMAEQASLAAHERHDAGTIVNSLLTAYDTIIREHKS